MSQRHIFLPIYGTFKHQSNFPTCIAAGFDSECGLLSPEKREAENHDGSNPGANGKWKSFFRTHVHRSTCRLKLLCPAWINR